MGKNKKTAQNGTHGIPIILNLIMLGIIEQKINVQKFAEPAEKGHQNKLTTSLLTKKSMNYVPLRIPDKHLSLEFVEDELILYFRIFLIHDNL